MVLGERAGHTWRRPRGRRTAHQATKPPSCSRSSGSPRSSSRQSTQFPNKPDPGSLEWTYEIPWSYPMAEGVSLRFYDEREPVGREPSHSDSHAGRPAPSLTGDSVDIPYDSFN